jgi:Tol biopolymer transport system component
MLCEGAVIVDRKPWTLSWTVLFLGAVFGLRNEVTEQGLAQVPKQDTLVTVSPGPVDPRVPRNEPQIFRVNADGSGPKPVTTGADPALSPNGEQVAFIASKEGSRTNGLYVVNVDGSGLKRLKDESYAISLAPSWSPDGKRIAFCTVCPDHKRLFTDPELYVVDADGRNLKRVGKIHGLMPSWSPNGKRLLFTRLEEDRWDLYATDIDGANARELVKDAIMGAWSPDGEWLAYMRAEKGLYVARADGSSPKWLAGRRDESLRGLQWSKDGKRLFFTREIPGAKTEPGSAHTPTAVYVIDVDGRNLHRLTARDKSEALGGTVFLRH